MSRIPICCLLLVLCLAPFAQAQNCNTTPVAQDDRVGWTGTQTIEVLTNDYDPAGQPMYVWAAQRGTGGSVTISADKRTILFTPDAGATTGTFTYTAGPSSALTDPATVTVQTDALPPPPAGTFNFSCTEFSCSFVAEPSNGTGIQSYRWEWGDGTVSDPVTTKATSHTFPTTTTNVTRNVKLTVRYLSGQIANITRDVTVGPTQPDVKWTYDNTGGSYLDIWITSTNVPGIGSSWQYYIDWGDGTPLQWLSQASGVTNVHNAHIYDTDNTFRVAIQLRKTTNGVTETVDFPKWIEVKNLAPVPHMDAYQLDRKTWKFDPVRTWDELGVDSPPGYRPEPYEWNFDDGEFATGTFDPATGKPLPVTHTFTAPGRRKVRLRVTDVRGATGEDWYFVDVPDDPPVAAFDFDCEHLRCVFDPARAKDDKAITSYTWFIDGVQQAQTATPDLFRPFWYSGQYKVTLQVSDGVFAPASFTRTVKVDGVPETSYKFFALNPCRLYDSRANGGAPVAGGQRITIPAAGQCGIPSTAWAVQVTPVILAPNGPGYLQMGAWSSSVLPVTAVMTFDSVRWPRAANTIVPLHRTGAFEAFASIAAPAGTAPSTHLVVDVTGYFANDAAPADPLKAAGPLTYAKLEPCRGFDSRNTSILNNGVAQFLGVRARCGVPAEAKAAALNLTMVMPTTTGHVTLYPSDLASMPAPYSTTNVIPNTNIANGTIMRLGRRTSDDLAIVYNASTGNTSHAIIDTFGYFADSAPNVYYPLSLPCRAVDTRDANRGDARLVSGSIYEYQIQGNCSVPRGAVAAAVTVTAVSPDANGHLVAMESGLAPTATSILNVVAGEASISNGLVLPLGSANRDLAIKPSLNAAGAGVHLVIDVVGYFGPPSIPANLAAPLSTPTNPQEEQ